MDRLEALSIFVAVLDGGSLADAGRKLGCSAAKVTRAIAQTEAMAGERLLDRSARRFAPTEAGVRHAVTFRRILDDFDGLRAGPPAVVSGTVTVTAPELFGRLHVLPAIQSFQKAHPDVRVRLLLMNRLVDLMSEGIDVAVRLATLPDSSLLAVKVGTVRRLTCAAPSYLAGRPRPAHPADLTDHWCIGLNGNGTQDLWQYRGPTAPHRLRSVRVTCRLATNSAATAIAAAEAGEGIIRPLSYQVRRQIADGTLETLLDRHEPAPLPVHLLFRPNPGKVARALIDHAVPLLRNAI